ncbi:PDC sensor domain-containing protein [Limnospira fusiformis]|uniref:PDC sensor domain-containing protein n=1 Tax=Limnospira fusiformis TaxID=54297 RepID=UPI00061B3566|nr:HAMP domain-containing protein [Limnospira fusiformis SAG 85.79]
MQLASNLTPRKAMKKIISIRHFIPALVVLPLLWATITTGVLAFYSGRKAVNSLMSELSQKSINSIEKHIDNYLKVPEIVNTINLITIENNLIDINNRELLTRYFHDQVDAIDGLYYIYLGTETGDFLGVQKQPDGTQALVIGNAAEAAGRSVYQLDSAGVRAEKIRTLEAQYDARQRPWYRSSLEIGEISWSPIYIFGSTLELGMTSTIPVKSPGGDTMGVVGIDLGLKDLSNFLRSLEISPQGIAFIMDRAGNLVASSTDEQPFLNENGQQRRLLALESQEPVIRSTVQHLLDTELSLNQIQQPISSRFRLNRERQLLQVTPMESMGLDWLIVVVIPESDFMELIYNNLRFTMIIGLGVTVVAITLGGIASWWIIKPIDNLHAGAKAIKANSFDPEMLESTISRSDEMAELGQAFVEMAAIVQAREKSMSEELVELHRQQEQWRRASHQNLDPTVRFQELMERARQARQNRV